MEYVTKQTTWVFLLIFCISLNPSNTTPSGKQASPKHARTPSCHSREELEQVDRLLKNASNTRTPISDSSSSDSDSSQVSISDSSTSSDSDNEISQEEFERLLKEATENVRRVFNLRNIESNE